MVDLQRHRLRGHELRRFGDEVPERHGALAALAAVRLHAVQLGEEIVEHDADGSAGDGEFASADQFQAVCLRHAFSAPSDNFLPSLKQNSHAYGLRSHLLSRRLPYCYRVRTSQG